MKGFDRVHARGPWRALPTPAFLADRGAGLRFQLGWAAGLAVLVGVAALAVNGPMGGRLLTGRALDLIWGQSLPTLLLGLGAAVALARGGLDLSGVAVAGLAGGLVATTGSPALALAAALGVGLASGLLVALVRAPGWLVTALMAFVVQALARAAFGARTVLELPDGALSWSQGELGMAAAAAALLAVAAFQVLPGAARGSRWRDLLADAVPYVFSSALAGLSGLFLVGRLQLAQLPYAPGSRWSEVLLVAVLGGGWLGAGRASVVGAVVAALALGALRFALQVAGFPSQWEAGIQLLLLVLGIGVSTAAHAVAARRDARRRENAAPAAAPPDDRPRRHDRALFHGPGRVLPIPLHLIRRRWALRLDAGWCLGLAVGLVALAGAFWRTDPSLLDFATFAALRTEALVPALLALGACAVVARGGWDLSAPALVGLTAYLAASRGEAPGSPALALLVAAGVGVANGALVSLARVPGWVATAVLALAVQGVRLGLLLASRNDASFAPSSLGWLRTGGWILLQVAAAAAVLWLQLAPGGRIDRPLVRWRERLADGLPYLFSSLLAGLAGLVLLAQLGRIGPQVVVGGDALAVVILAGCWLGSGRANVLGALLAVTGIVGVGYLGVAADWPREVGPAVVAGLALLALAASRVVHLAAGRAYALRERAAPDAQLRAVQPDGGPG